MIIVKVSYIGTENMFRHSQDYQSTLEYTSRNGNLHKENESSVAKVYVKFKLNE